MTPIISWKRLRNLPVETQSGQRLGVLVDVEINPEHHTIQTYIIAPGRIASTITRSYLRISHTQVISITTERMIVEDLVGAKPVEGERARPRFTKDIAPAVPAHMRSLR